MSEQTPNADTSAPLTCRELVELITDYLEGTLAPRDRERFEAHLAGCAGCTNYLQQMRWTIATVGALSESAITPEAERDLLDVFRDWKRERADG